MQVITCTIVIENTSKLVQFYLQWPICVINPYDNIHWPKITLYYLITTMMSIFKELIYCKHCCSVF